jgi:hypothetical protein
MRIESEIPATRLSYRPGLDPVEEAIISSHFMQQLCADSGLGLYDREQFRRRSVHVPAEVIIDRLLPAILRAARQFARDRASASRQRARRHVESFGLGDGKQLGPAEFITEVLFDPQFRAGSRETCSREDLSRRISRCVARGRPIEMVIPALPYKFSCPLKTRGQLPDLAELNFLIGLYEIVQAIEILYREAQPTLRLPLARFTVVSDGSRFNDLVNEPHAVVTGYQERLTHWIHLLHLEEHIELVDYRSLLNARLPVEALRLKEALRERAQRLYHQAMWPHFDPSDMAGTLKAALLNDPDPESSSTEGRFVSLFKSLVFTVRYRALDGFRSLPSEQLADLYREMTAHLFEPFSEARTGADSETAPDYATYPLAARCKERLRRRMLEEVWTATIAYVAEIKSDRDQEIEPISRCYPDHLRWSIHAKPGQLGLLAPSAFGRTVQAWAGAAVFKRTKRGRIKLCTLPVLALEGAGAIPVLSGAIADAAESGSQPIFYVHPDTDMPDVFELIDSLPSKLARRRAN